MKLSGEWDSKAYERLSNPQLRWGRRVLDRVAELPLRGDERVLDAGCGTARVTFELVDLFPKGRVFGVDLSENMLRTARQKPVRDILFLCADLSALPFHACFDGVFSTAAFHWVKDHEQLFRSIYEALKSGGWLVAQCGGGPNLANIRSRARRVMNTPAFSRFFEGWSEPWEFADAQITSTRLRKAGFVEIRTWLEEAGFAFPGPSEYRDYMATVTMHQHLDQIPDPKLRDAFLDELVVEAQREGSFHMDYWRLNIQAIRASG